MGCMPQRISSRSLALPQFSDVHSHLKKTCPMRASLPCSRSICGRTVWVAILRLWARHLFWGASDTEFSEYSRADTNPIRPLIFIFLSNSIPTAPTRETFITWRGGLSQRPRLHLRTPNLLSLDS